MLATSEVIGGRFRLERLLGAGAMGQVWLANDERLQRLVAIKVVSPDGLETASTLRLEREARAAAAVQHQNVVPVFDFLHEGDRSLIVMEYVVGETLADRMTRTGPIPLDDAVEFTAQICDGLDAAHRLQLVHRDLKPANVIITGDGLAKVLDFGIAKRTDQTEKTLTQTGAVLGTPQFMAPEQLSGEEIDGRTDLHAAGLMLYEMLSGRPAFGGETIAQLMYRLVSEQADFTVLSEAGVPDDIIAIIRCALEKRRDDRWPTGKMMAEALRVGLYGEVMRSRRTPTPSGMRQIIGAPPTPIPTPSNRVSNTAVPTNKDPSLATMLSKAPVATRRMAGIGIAAMAVVVAIVIGIGSVTNREPNEERPIIRPELNEKPPAPVVSPDTNAREPQQETNAAKPKPEPVKPSPDAEIRGAYAAAVQRMWARYAPTVAAELGDRMPRTQAEFAIRVSEDGRITDIRPARLSSVDSFDNNAGQAVQEVDRVATGGQRKPGGWRFRVQFEGRSVRVR